MISKSVFQNSEGADRELGLPELQTMAAAIGFEKCAVGIDFRAMNENCYTPHAVHSTYPEAWRQFYFENDFMRVDPAIHIAVKSHEPVRWSAMRGRYPKDPVLSAASDFGLDEGVVLPIRLASRLSICSWTSEATTLSDLDIEQLLMISRLFVKSELRRADGARIASVLTHTQVEILQLLAMGLSQQRTAERLGVKPETIKYHLQKIGKKLHVNNTAAAIATAVRLGIL